MSLKENFYQAIKELFTSGGLVGSDLEEKTKAESRLDSYLDVPNNQQRASEPEPEVQESSAQEPEPAPPKPETPPRTKEEPRYAAGFVSEPQTVSSARYQTPDEMTVISRNTLVEGNIRSFANITINGSVKGKVDIFKDANLHGMLLGDLTCNNADMVGSSIQGNIYTKGRVFLDNDSLLLGDMTAQYASVDGKIKGNMNVAGKTEILQNAIIAGDVRTGSIAVTDGANIEGFVTTAYLAENRDSAFPTKIEIDEEFML